MPGLDPGIHAPPPERCLAMESPWLNRVDGRVKPGHDDEEANHLK